MNTQSKFNIDGVELLIHSEVENAGFIVSKIYEEGISPEQYFLPYDSIYDTPPTLKLDARIKGLQDKIENLQKWETELFNSVEEKRRQFNELNKDIEQFKIVSPIFDFAKGKPIFFVNHHTLKILDYNDLKYDKDSVRMVAITGNHARQLEWRLNNYQDGSGSSARVSIYFTFEDAVKGLQEVVDDILKTAKLANSPDSYDKCKLSEREVMDKISYYMLSVIANAHIEYNINLHPDILALYYKGKKDEKLKLLEKLRITLEVTQTQIRNLEASID